MIPRRSMLTLIPAALGVLFGPLARADVPSPQNSIVDPCIRVCSAGDMNLHVEVRDAANNPQPFSSVSIDFCSCLGIVLCPPGPADPYLVSGCQVVATANASGVLDVGIRAGGVCSGSVVVRADGVIIAIRNAVSSPDQNGDLTVNAVDNGILTTKLGGPYDPTGDLNCSGTLESGDTTVLLAHGGHSCQVAVPVQPRSWGTIKLIYR